MVQYYFYYPKEKGGGRGDGRGGNFPLYKGKGGRGDERLYYFLLFSNKWEEFGGKCAVMEEGKGGRGKVVLNF